MLEKVKKTIDTLLVLFVLGFILLPVLLVAYFFCSYGAVYETNDIADYGTITGNFENDMPKEFIFSFFPDEIHPEFSDVTYHYKAKKGDAYAYECYLEFVIEDPGVYQDFLAGYADISEPTAFAYDAMFMEHSVSNILDIHWKSPNEENGYPMERAKIGKVLYCDAEQRIIFFALGIWDGGGTDTSELNYFFSKFNINVVEYQMVAFYSDMDQENGLTYQERHDLGMETRYSNWE